MFDIFLRSERLLHWFNWQLTKILQPVAFLVFQSTSCPSFSLSCGPDGTLSALWATAMPGFTVTWEAVAASHASGRHWERWWPDWSGRQRHHGCPSAFQAGGGVATPSLPGGRPSSSASPQHTAGWRRRSGGWRWTVELQQYDVHCATTYIYSLNRSSN